VVSNTIFQNGFETSASTANIGTVSTRYAYLQSKLVGTVENGTVTATHTDFLGSVLADSALNNVVIRPLYEAYGAPGDGQYRPGPGFTGHITDTTTRLSYMQQRYYDPYAGRFLQIDPKAADAMSFGRYHYAANNPYKYVDPDGRAIEYSYQNGATLLDGIKTMAYLLGSETAAGEISRIENSEQRYMIVFDGGNLAESSYDEETRTINVGTTSGLIVGEEGEIQSPAIGAGHEISHAAEHDRIGTDALLKNLEAPLLNSEMKGDAMVFQFGTSEEEKRATAVETKIARELGEPTRKNYTDEKGPVKTCGPTSREQC
jgi:RHS repeat-associated protein